MTTTSDTDIKELKEFIASEFKQVNVKLESLDKRLTKVEATLEAWKPSIDKVADLAEKVGELKNWRQTALLIISVIGGGIFGWILRSGNP